MLHRTNSAIVLRKIGGRFDALWSATGLRAGDATLSTPAVPSLTGLAMAFCALLILPVLVLAGAVFALHGAGHHGIGLVAEVGLVTQRPLTTILGELKEIQEKYKGKVMPEAEGQKFDTLATEAKSLQDAADRERQIKGFERFASEVVDPALPAEGKSAGRKESEVVGYMTPGGAFVESKEYKRFMESGMPEAPSPAYGVKDIHRGLIPVTRADVEGKAVATTGGNFILPSRDNEIVRTTEQDRLVLRDILNVQQTDSNAVEYPTLTSSTRAAAPVAESAAKPEATLAVGTATAPVRTIAVWMPITEQQLQDIPQLRGIIDTELLYDLDKTEEEEIVWGTGTGQHLLGIMNAGITASRAVGGDTIIDSIRRMITDIAVAGGTANAAALDPIDMETVLLSKGTDSRYIWTVAPGGDGVQRIWGLKTVETVAMRQPISLGGGATTQARRVLVGDFQRGATLYDRQQSNVAIGWINDQFVRNQRTIRAEERVAFAAKRPKFFRYLQTQANV